MSRADITKLLRQAAVGDARAESQLFEAIYAQLKTIARGMLARERRDHTLEPTALVHETFLRLRGRGIDWQDRGHFFAVAARAMRRVLVDHARARLAKKRPQSDERVPVEESLEFSAADPVTVLAVDDAVTRLATVDERQARIVEMRFFGGLTEEEIAEAFGISSRTVKREWRVARLWLFSQLASSSSSSSSPSPSSVPSAGSERGKPG
jgi:RNA polymerase sigma-70 factor, ECF subfamily